MRIAWGPSPARVVKLADTGGLNPPDLRVMRVRTPPRAQVLSWDNTKFFQSFANSDWAILHRSCTECYGSTYGTRFCTPG